jgi:hypothetical protein
LFSGDITTISSMFRRNRYHGYNIVTEIINIIVICVSFNQIVVGYGSVSTDVSSRVSIGVMIQSTNSFHKVNRSNKFIEVPRGGGAESMIDSIPESVDLGHLIEDAYAWCCSLGAPSALVAAAVVATIYENMHSGDLEIDQSDGRLVQLGKKLTRLLLLSAFALETLSIFVTTVTGTMLLSRKHDQMLIANKDVTTPLEFLKENFEFEYLTASITFLQGLMHWLAAIGLGHLLPSPGDPPDTPTEIALNKFIAWGMATLILLMISFFNNHISFYNNYTGMLMRWFYVTLHGHVFGIGTWPPRPMSLALMTTLAASLYYGYISLSRSEAPNENKL